ncbi:MAG: sulfatase-like hydrolase/transferase [Kiritimatiellia bacterium]|nr:sulfatase-like hydrolase/transferase [Lentisphaerota bacterium]
MSKQKSNIVFIHTDSMDGRVMGCMGHPAMRHATPNIDRLAAEGVIFRNAYSNNPICCPSRASMLSGAFTHHCEAWNNHKGLEADTPTFLDHLEQAGYRNTVLGKTDYLSGQHSVCARVTSWLRAAAIDRPVQRTRGPEVEQSEERRFSQKDWSHVDQAVAWLENESDGDKPFFLYLGLNQPHHPFRTTLHYLRMIDESGVLLPPPDETPHPVTDHQRAVKGWSHGYSADMVLMLRKVYFAMIAEVDTMVGEVLDTLDRRGLRGSTTVIFSSDHGELAMEHGQVTKMSLYEPSVRVPLIMAGPGLPAGQACYRLVSLVDIYPTLMDLAGGAGPSGLDGHSLLPSATGGHDGRPDWVLSEVHTVSCRTGAFMLRRGDWKYIAYPGFPPQLFNLREDPDEIRNLSDGRPEIAADMEKLLQSILDYEKVDARVKQYDRASFRKWREERLETGDYHKFMGDFFSSNNSTQHEQAVPWTDRDEKVVERWLNRK